MIKVKIFGSTAGISMGSVFSGPEKMVNKWLESMETNINEWLKHKIDTDIIDIKPGYGFVVVTYKAG